MARTLSAHLQALAPDDLEALLRRRSEIRWLVSGRRRPDFDALAEVLSRPEAMRHAAMSLTKFLNQLLQLGLWLGPEVSVEALADEAPEVPLADLRAGAEELARWGLAFVVECPGKGQWSLAVPAATAASVATPAGFGPLARRLLAQRTPDFLRTVAGFLGLLTRPHAGKDAQAAEIAAVLADPDRVDALLAEAPPRSQALFELIRGEGAMTRHELMTGGHVRWSDPPWGERRKIVTPLDWLESRALVIYDAETHYTGTVLVPAEVELALRGGRIFAAWPPASPPPLALPAAKAPAHAGGGDPTKILVEMGAVLEEWAATRPTALQRGGLGVRELRRSAKALNFPEPYVSFLYALAVEAGFIGVDDDGRVVPTPQASTWAAQPAPQRWARLFEAWQTSRLWSEQEGLVALDKVVGHLWVYRLRTGIVEDLASLPPGAVSDAQHLGSRTYFRQPALFHCEDCAQNLATKALEALVWLGAATGPGPASLLEPARSAVADPQWWRTEGPGTQAFAAEVSACTVGADMNIIVPGPPVHELGSALGRFAELKASSPARIYRLSEASLRRAFDDGMQTAEILSVLERHAPKGVPQNVSYLIEDVGRRHGHLVAGEVGLYLRSDDPGLLRSALADRRLAAFRPRLIAPTVAVLSGDSVEALLVTLRGAGYFPVAEDGGGTLRGRAAATTVRPLINLGHGAGPISRGEAATLAAAIRQATPPAVAAPPKAKRKPLEAGAPLPGLLDGRTLTDRRDIVKLVELAIEEALVLEVSYLSLTSGRRTLRQIEPMVLENGALVAWCRLRDDERRFVLAGIEWARATGERYLDDAQTGEEILNQ